MLEQSSVELENTISNLEEKKDNVEDEGNLLLDHDPINSQSGENSTRSCACNVHERGKRGIFSENLCIH